MDEDERNDTSTSTFQEKICQNYLHVLQKVDKDTL